MNTFLTYRHGFWIGLVAAAAFLPACGLFGGKDKVDPSMTSAETSSTQRREVSAESQEAQLREIVEEHVARAARVDSPEAAPVVKLKPYFLKEFTQYPAGTSSMEVSIRETQSRMAPRVADVTLPKLRYATRMHRKRDVARGDSHFYRETGNETLTYQWRNGRWAQVASMFVVDAKEEQVGGEWRAVEPAPEEQPVLPGGDEGFFRRMFGGIFGR